MNEYVHASVAGRDEGFNSEAHSSGPRRDADRSAIVGVRRSRKKYGEAETTSAQSVSARSRCALKSRWTTVATWSMGHSDSTFFFVTNFSSSYGENLIIVKITRR
jgi:hypothetical protein